MTELPPPSKDPHPEESPPSTDVQQPALRTHFLPLRSLRSLRACRNCRPAVAYATMLFVVLLTALTLLLATENTALRSVWRSDRRALDDVSSSSTSTSPPFMQQQRRRDCSSSPSSSASASDITYNLAHLLNLPAFANRTDVPTVTSRHLSLAEAHVAACAYPTSLLAHYDDIPSMCAVRPFRPHLRQALRAYEDAIAQSSSSSSSSWRSKDAKLAKLVARPDTLTVQLGDADDLSDVFRDALRIRVERGVTDVVLVPTEVAMEDGVLARLVAIVKNVVLGARSGVTIHERRSPVAASTTTTDTTAADDDTLLLLSKASTLLLHKGGLAALAALANQGLVVHTPAMAPYFDNTAFQWQVENSTDGDRIQPRPYVQRWNKLAPVLPTCCQTEHLGRGDGEKFVCANSAPLHQPGCWVLSIGCGGLFDFERLVVMRWNCDVHVFDCTGSWRVPDDIAHRVTLRKLCVGGAGSELRENHRSLNGLIELVRKEGGERVQKMPALFKLDAEGAEYPVLHDMLRDVADDKLPVQMVIEFHLTVWTDVGFLYTRNQEPGHPAGQWVMAQEHAEGLMANLSKRGYRVVHRADNPGDETCSELTLVLQDRLPSVVGPV